VLRSFNCAIIKLILIFILLFSALPEMAIAADGDFNLDGIFEAALDLPRIHFLLKRDPCEPAIEYQGNFELNWGFLDTGASGMLLSRETFDALELNYEPGAVYADVGIGGAEFFDVSEFLYVGTAGYNDPDPYNQSHYILSDRWHLQVKQTYAGLLEQPIDLLGMPVMAGKTVVLDAGATNRLEYFAADIKENGDSEIPPVDFNVPLRFEKYIMPEDPCNIPPLPVLAYNPVIDNIVVEYNGQSSSGSWLLDTGGTISLMSVAQATTLGLTEPNGNPIVTPDFVLEIGGIGGSTELPGFQIDNLIVPTLNGYNLIFNNARICVYDIGITDVETGEFILLDGIFGSNFLCASAKIIGGLPVDLAQTPFEKIVIDMQKGLLGFDVNDVYPLPSCGDAHHPQPTADVTGDCKVNIFDAHVFAENWLGQGCNSANNFCNGCDIISNGKVDFVDYGVFANQWQQSAFAKICGDSDNPWPDNDLNRDCRFDFKDLKIFTDEWLNDCDWLDWNCRGADIKTDQSVDFHDYAELLKAD